VSAPLQTVSIVDRRGAPAGTLSARLVLARTLPAWMLRLGLAAIAAGIVAVLSTEGVPGGVLIIFGFVALAALLVPASLAAAVLGGGAALVLAVFSDGNPVRPAVLATIVLVHLLHVVTGLVAVIPAGSRIHLTALRRPALRFLGIQAAVFALVALAWRLPRSQTPALIEIAALLGVTGIAALALVLLRRN
jgi:hypothetical protein